MVGSGCSISGRKVGDDSGARTGSIAVVVLCLDSGSKKRSTMSSHDTSGIVCVLYGI